MLSRQLLGSLAKLVPTTAKAMLFLIMAEIPGYSWR
jgi:hypothetical protein